MWCNCFKYSKKYEQPNQCNGNNLITPSLFRNAIKSQGGLKLIHFNARSLKGVNSCKIDQLRILLDNKFFDILAVSETWFNSTISDDEVGITGYNLHRKDRAPSSTIDYFNDMICNFESAMTHSEIGILDNFNYNYVLDETLSKNPAHLIELILNCSQLITEPTRRTLNTSTTLDLIFTSTPQLHRSSGVIECSITDHDFIFTVIKHSNVNNSSPNASPLVI